MTAEVKKVFHSVLSLTPNERAFLAHLLIHSLEQSSSEDNEKQWIELAEKRFLELKSGQVKGVSWDAIKKSVRAKHSHA